MADDGQLDPNVPPVGEEVHLPGNTVLPLIMAASIAVALVGLTSFIGFTIAGVLIFLWTFVRWIREVRAEIQELPPEHQ